MRYLSPLRYPGGKATLAGFLADTVALNDLEGAAYYEPYAGGAGAALGLLNRGIVSDLILNDADRRVYAFWHSVLRANDEFVDRVLTVPLSIDEWRRQELICSHPRGRTQFEIGFAAFYMNRCNRSGVLTGSGPIGGYEQTGEWRIGVRFNRENLAERLIALKKAKRSIKIYCLDAIEFLKRKLPSGNARKRLFVYLDPPFVSNGRRLYFNSYEEPDHVKLSRYLRRQTVLPWITSYDDSNLIRRLYRFANVALLPIQYSLQEKRSSSELIISPRHVAVPRTCRSNGREHAIVAPR